MAKLILSMDGLVLKEIALSKERTTIGRKPHNDVQIDNLAVSGEHAVIVTILNDAFLEDLGSTNGTMVNGKAIKKHFLHKDDVIELGKYKLKYIEEKVPQQEKETAAAADFEKTMVLRPAAMKAAVEQAKAMAGGQPAVAEAARAAAVQQAATSAAAAGVADKDARAAPAPSQAPAVAPAGKGAPAAPAAAPSAAPAPAPAPSAAPVFATAATPAPAAPTAPPASAPKPAPMLGAIQLLSGANAGKELELLKPLTTLGRPGVQVAVLTRRPQGYYITHVEGAQQPVVNGQAIGNAPHPLKDHDVIELAGVKLEFFLKG